MSTNLIEPFPRCFTAEARSSGLGGANPKRVFKDDRDKWWLFKPQTREQTAVDIAAAETLQMIGLPTPILYYAEFGWHQELLHGSIQPYLKETTKKFGLSVGLTDLSDDQRGMLQKHHVGDFMIANPDSHRAQFLILNDDTLVAIDKSQALRFFPHDTLNWFASAWPLNTKLPVYVHLFEMAKAKKLRLQPQVAIDFAREAEYRLNSQGSGWLREKWNSVVETWSWYRLTCATLHVAKAKDQAVSNVLAKIEERRDSLVDEFDKLYFDKSQMVWSRGHQSSGSNMRP